MGFKHALKSFAILPVFLLGTSCSSVFEHNSTLSAKPLLTALADMSKSSENNVKPKPLFSSANKSNQTKTSQKSYTPKSTSTIIRGVRTTAYCHLENEPGAYGNLNAIGTSLRYYAPIRSAAADWSKYPLGTQFRIVGQSQLYEIDDFGSALVGNGTIDFYKPSLEAMDNWGLRYIDIEVVKWGSWSKSISYLSPNSGYWHVRQMYHHLYAKLN